MERKAVNLIWVLIGLVSVIAVVAIAVSILFGGRYINGTYGPYSMMSGGYYGMGIIMPIIGIISVIFVFVFVFFIFESLRGPEYGNQRPKSVHAEEIAKERYARGEISEAEYTTIMEKINK